MGVACIIRIFMIFGKGAVCFVVGFKVSDCCRKDRRAGKVIAGTFGVGGKRSPALA